MTETLEIYIKLKVEFFSNRYVKISFKYLDALHRFWTIQKKIEWNSYAICFGWCCCHVFFSSSLCLFAALLHSFCSIHRNQYQISITMSYQPEFRHSVTNRPAACMHSYTHINIYYVLRLQKSSGNVVHFGRLVGYRFITANLFFSSHSLKLWISNHLRNGVLFFHYFLYIRHFTHLLNHTISPRIYWMRIWFIWLKSASSAFIWNTNDRDKIEWKMVLKFSILLRRNSIEVDLTLIIILSWSGHFGH